MHLAGEWIWEQWPEEATEWAELRLVGAVLGGDHAAFDALVRQHSAQVTSVVRRISQEPNEVEDLVQETFLRAYQHLRRFRGRSQLRTWLIQIVINVCRDRQRSFWKRRVRLSLPEGPDPAQAGFADAAALGAAWLVRPAPSPPPALEQTVRALPRPAPRPSSRPAAVLPGAPSGTRTLKPGALPALTPHARPAGRRRPVIARLQQAAPPARRHGTGPLLPGALPALRLPEVQQRPSSKRVLTIAPLQQPAPANPGVGRTGKE